MSGNIIEHIIPLSEPEISGNEWKYVKECLDTGWVSSVGSYVEKFERVVADYVGSAHGVAVINGTSALHLSMLACGVKADDEVIVPTFTFIAPVNAVRYCGAYPVFMDCDIDTLSMDVNKVVDFIEKECFKHADGFLYNRTSKRRVRAVIPVHIFGHPVDMEALMSIASQNNIAVIEDATESLGSHYKNEETGSLGDIGCFSFNGNKIITSGGGGMVTTNNKALADRVRHLSTQANRNGFEYDHDEVGYNYRLTNIQAAMGVAQMERLDEFVALKRKNAAIYKDLFSGSENVKFMWENTWARSNFWLYNIRVPQSLKKGLIEYLLSVNIRVRPAWKLIHTLQMYKACQAYAVENAVAGYESCISIPCGIKITQEEIRYVSDKILGYMKTHGKNIA